MLPLQAAVNVAFIRELGLDPEDEGWGPWGAKVVTIAHVNGVSGRLPN